MRVPTIAISALLLVSANASAQQVLHETTWDATAPPPTADATVIASDGFPLFAQLKIENPSPQPKTVTLMVLDDPQITERRYALTGSVRYEDVEGLAYLELWSTLASGRRAFSRTLTEEGPTQTLTGTSDWHDFVLPFAIHNDSSWPPSALELNVVLPGRGTIYVGPVRLVQYAGLADPLTPAGAWWGSRQAGLFGGIGGGAVGILGALVGVLGSLGRARRVVMACGVLTLVVGVTALIAGAVALTASQPYAVYYPLLLGGVLCTVLPVSLAPALMRRYREAELRRMQAMDAG